MELQPRQELTDYILRYIWKAKNAQKAGKCIEREVLQQTWEEWMEFKEVQIKGQERMKKKIVVEEQKE